MYSKNLNLQNVIINKELAKDLAKNHLKAGLISKRQKYPIIFLDGCLSGLRYQF
jgi:hypothetical protein